jgi:hypothetical protein
MTHRGTDEPYRPLQWYRHPVVLLIVAAAIWALFSVWRDGREADATDPPAPTTRSVATVLYEVEGSVEWADVTLRTPTGTEQLTPDVPLHTKSGKTGLTYEFPAGGFVYIAAQMKDSFGTIRCRITVNGIVVAENESSADYGIAQCQGRV